MCIVNAHLPAYDDKVADRIESVNSILDAHNFHDRDAPTILKHDYVFWMGDLNFRLERVSKPEAERMIAGGHTRDLLAFDQLRALMKDGTLFSDFVEPEVAFAPTYKFDPGSDRYDTSEKARKPAYCDRILYYMHKTTYSGAKLDVCKHFYRPIVNIRCSDHRPVTALFTLSVPFRPVNQVTFDSVKTTISPNGHVVSFEFTFESDSLEPKTSGLLGGGDWIALFRVCISIPVDCTLYSISNVLKLLNTIALMMCFEHS